MAWMIVVPSDDEEDRKFINAEHITHMTLQFRPNDLGTEGVWVLTIALAFGDNLTYAYADMDEAEGALEKWRMNVNQSAV